MAEEYEKKMNAGLANLATLKRHLLPDTWETETSMDAILLDLGRGVASQMEEFCARKFGRVVNVTYEQQADTILIQLPRFPIEGTPVVEIRYQGSSVWEAQVGVFDNVAASVGLLYLTYPLGTSRDRIRVTYTGGFWWNAADAPDADEVLPDGATELPAGLQFNWLLQCQHILAARELLGLRTLPSGKAALAVTAEAQIQLLQTVKDALQPYRLLAL